ncbi:MAG: ABC transporter substrate-binding protein [Beutenbergiaceae bacterium]
MKRSRSIAAIAAIGALALASACTSSDGGEGESNDGGGDADVLRFQTKPPRNADDIEFIEARLAAFTDETGIEVELDVIPSQETQRTLLQTQLQAGEGPDIFTYDTGPAYAGELAAAGSLLDLTDAYAERGWEIYDWAIGSVTFDDKLYGVPDEVEGYGIFYNKDMFADLGLAEPQTLDELREAAQTIKDAGTIPFAFGNQEGFEATHQFSMILNSQIGSEGVQRLVDGEDEWTSPDVVAALDLFAGEFARDGFLPDDVTAIDFDGQNQMFYAEEAAMLPTATVLLSSMQTSVDFEVGFIPYPSDDGPGILTAALGGGYFIGANARNTEGALQLLDFLTTSDQRRYQAENLVIIPAGPFDTDGMYADPLLQDVLAQAIEANESGTPLGISIELVSSDEFNKTLFDGLQLVLLGDMDAETLAQNLQDLA